MIFSSFNKKIYFTDLFLAFVFAQIYCLVLLVYSFPREFTVLYCMFLCQCSLQAILAQVVMSRTPTMRRIPVSFHQWLELEQFRRFLQSWDVLPTPEIVERFLARQHWRFDKTRKVRLYHIVITDLPQLVWEVHRMQRGESQRRQPYNMARP